MTSSTPVEEVVQLLSAAGYRSLPIPLSIAGVSFELPAALVGESPSPDLVIVADTAFDTERNVLRKIEGVARALDVARSKRPLTAILVGPKPSAVIIDAMTRVCRVLPIGVMEHGTTSSMLENWLAVLLPLQLPEPTNDTAESLESIVSRSSDLDADIVSLVDLADQGAWAIQNRLHELLSAALENEPERANSAEGGGQLSEGASE
jgi:hypothetical protein